MHTTPTTEVHTGKELSLKRCHLCQWAYGRVVMAQPCGHTICTVCLGLTCLIR